MTALQRIQRLRILDEAAGSSTFAADLSASIASFKDLRFNSAELQLITEMLQDEAVVQRAYQERLDIIGQKRFGMNVTVPLSGTGSAIVTATTTPVYTDTALSILLKTWLGGFQSGAGSAEATGTSSTASSVTVTTGQGSRFTAGSAFGTVIAGRLEAREIDAVSTDALIPKVALSAAPTNLADVNNARTYYLTNEPTTSMQFVCETTERDAIYWGLGCQMTAGALNLPLGQVPTLDCTIQGANWLQDDSVATPLGGSAIAAATLTEAAPAPNVNNQWFFCTGSEPYTYATAIANPSAVAITINRPYEILPGPGGVNGIVRWVAVPQRPMATLKLTLPIDSGNIKTYQTARDAQTMYSFFAQVGNVAGSTWLISLPALQITDVQRVVGPAGLWHMEVTCKAYEDQDTVTATELGYSPVRLHQL